MKVRGLRLRGNRVAQIKNAPHAGRFFFQDRAIKYISVLECASFRKLIRRAK